MTTEKMMTMKMSDAGDNDSGHEMPKKSHTVEEDKVKWQMVILKRNDPR